jgi:hypothetical protein
MRDLVRRRLASQHLAKPSLAAPAELVHAFGAVQAQDYAAARWAVGQRLVGATSALVERALDEGSILRTHVLRPTWHLVAQADIRWMLELTSPRVKAACAYQWRKLSLDEKTFRRASSAIEKALRGGKQLTRAELTEHLRRAKLDVAPSELVGHHLMRAELDGVICSGARRGKQMTYTLLEERVPKTATLSRDEALAELAGRYFSTRGPATAKDFAWWSGLTVSDAKRAVAMLKLEHADVDGVTHWFTDDAPRPARRLTAHLLANYDEYVVGVADRAAMTARLGAGVDAKALVFENVVVVDGQVVGTWARASGDYALQTTVRPPERAAIERAARRYREFAG